MKPAQYPEIRNLAKTSNVFFAVFCTQVRVRIFHAPSLQPEITFSQKANNPALNLTFVFVLFVLVPFVVANSIKLKFQQFPHLQQLSNT